MSQDKPERREQKACQFFQLRARGVDSARKVTSLSIDRVGKEDTERLLQEVRACLAYRKRGIDAFFRDDVHVDRREKPFLSKRAYLLDEVAASDITPDQLIYLLADWHTLFSRNFQTYANMKAYFSAALNQEERSPEEKMSAEQKAMERLSGRYTLERRMQELLITKEDLLKEKWLPDSLREFEEDRSRVERLRKLCADYSAWSDLPENLGPRASEKQEQRLLDEDDAFCDRLYAATSSYFAEVRYRKEQAGRIPVRELVIEASKLIAKDLRNQGTEELTPFLFVMQCVVQKLYFMTGLGYQAWRLSDVRRTPVSSYHISPSIRRQRLARIRFLDNLINIFHLRDDAALDNWKLFLEVHGNRIMSEEESRLWSEVTARVPGITPIELQLMGRVCLQNCLPARVEELACYRNASPLHLGGFFRYLKENPNVVPAIARMIPKSSGYWQEKENEYFTELFRYDYDLESVRELCLTLSRRAVIKWEKVPGATEAEQRAFCMSLRNTPDDEKTTHDMQELRSLLIEYAIIEDVGSRARLLLEQAFARIYNPNGDAFGMSISRRW